MKICFNKKPLKNFPLGENIFKLIKKYKNPKDSLVLEVGWGDGRFGSFFGDEFKKYFGIDPDKEYILEAKKKNKYKKETYRLGSAEKIPFKNKFDVIFLAFSWHFVNDFDKAMSEIKNALNEEGILIILEPSKKTKRWASPKLIRGNPKFDESLLKRKIFHLKIARNFLEKQNYLKIINKKLNETNIWILKNSKI